MRIHTLALISLVGEGQTAHTALDAENVVVDREHVHGGGSRLRWEGDRDLGVVDTREVASTSWLVLFWLEREGVRVHTWVWAARVVVVRLDLVEVLTLLGLESVLSIKNKLEICHWTNDFFGEFGGGTSFANLDEWHTSTLGDWHEAVTRHIGIGVGLEDNSGRTWLGGEVLEGSGDVTRRWVVEAPDQILDWVVVAETLVGSRARSDGIGASVLDLLDEVLVTLLRESAAFLGVEVHIVRPDLEHRGAQVGVEGGRQVEVNAHFVVLKGNEWQIQTWVAVEEEDQWQEHGVTTGRSGHLTPVSLLGFVQVKLGVQTPPALVVLVDALTTNGQFSRRNRTLGDPVVVITVGGAGVRRSGLKFDVHVADQITIAGNSHGD